MRFLKSQEDYIRGKVLTLGELKQIPNEGVIHIYYVDEDDNLRANEFKYLYKDKDNKEFSAEDYPFPVKKLSDDSLLDNVYNSGWHFTIREAILK